MTQTHQTQPGYASELIELAKKLPTNPTNRPYARICNPVACTVQADLMIEMVARISNY